MMGTIVPKLKHIHEWNILNGKNKKNSRVTKSMKMNLMMMPFLNSLTYSENDL